MFDPLPSCNNYLSRSKEAPKAWNRLEKTKITVVCSQAHLSLDKTRVNAQQTSSPLSEKSASMSFVTEIIAVFITLLS